MRFPEKTYAAVKQEASDRQKLITFKLSKLHALSGRLKQRVVTEAVAECCLQLTTARIGPAIQNGIVANSNKTADRAMRPIYGCTKKF